MEERLQKLETSVLELKTDLVYVIYLLEQIDSKLNSSTAALDTGIDSEPPVFSKNDQTVTICL